MPRRMLPALPGCGPELPLWAAALLALSAAIAPLAAPALLLAVVPDEEAAGVLISVGVAGGVAFALVVVAAFGGAIRDAYRTSRMHRAGRDLELAPSPRPGLKDLDEYGDFPLFSYSQGMSRAAVWSLEGAFQGVPVRALEYAFKRTYWDQYGRSRSTPEVQTLVFLRDAGPSARFYFGPGDSGWSVRVPSWHLQQGLRRSLVFSDTNVPIPPVAHASTHEVIRDLFTPQRQHDLAAFEGWVVECSGGTLLVYRHAHAITPDELPRLLLMATRLAEVMRDGSADAANQLLSEPETGSPLRRQGERDEDGVPLDIPSPVEVVDKMASEPPLPGFGWSPWIGAVLFLAMSASIVPFVLMMVFTAAQVEGEQKTFAVLTAFLLMGMWGGLTIAIYRDDIRRRWREWGVSRAGRSYGLHPVPRPTLQDLEEYRGFPLIRFTRQTRRAATWAMEGEFRGKALRLLEYVFWGAGVTRRGNRQDFEERLTLVVLPDAGPRRRFHIGPLETPWTAHEPNWARDQGLSSTREFSPARSAQAVVIHAPDDETIETICTPQFRQALAAFPGWVVECCQGDLLLYRHDHTVRPDQLAEFLDSVARLADLVRSHAAPVPTVRFGDDP